MKIPKKIPYMFGEQLPNGVYVTRIIEIDKTHPKWKATLKEFIKWEGKYQENEISGTVLTEKPVKSTKEGKKDQKEFEYTIPDEYWERVHNLDYLVENSKVDPVDTERHINFKVQDATLISSREEVERQHKAWHGRQKAKEKVMGDLEEALAIIDDDSTNPEGAELTDKQKAELKEVVKKAFEDA